MRTPYYYRRHEKQPLCRRLSVRDWLVELPGDFLNPLHSVAEFSSFLHANARAATLPLQPQISSVKSKLGLSPTIGLQGPWPSSWKWMWNIYRKKKSESAISVPRGNKSFIDTRLVGFFVFFVFSLWQRPIFGKFGKSICWRCQCEIFQSSELFIKLNKIDEQVVAYVFQMIFFFFTDNPE